MYNIKQPMNLIPILIAILKTVLILSFVFFSTHPISGLFRGAITLTVLPYYIYFSKDFFLTLIILTLFGNTFATRFVHDGYFKDR
jgi:hypothetical protein